MSIVVELLYLSRIYFFIFHGHSNHVFISVGKEIREKFSGAVEAFSRRNPTSSSPHGDHSKHRGFEEGAVHKDVVSFVF